MTDLTDEALVAAARNGDRAAFAALFERHRCTLFAVCRRAIDDRWLAEDAVQEAALRALLGLAQLRAPNRFGPWLCGIGLNVCRDFLRRRANEGFSWDELVGGRRVPEPAAIDDPEELAVDREVAARVRAAVAALPPGQRAAVLLYYLSGLRIAEAAAQLGVPAGALKTRLHKARANLRRDFMDLREETTMTETPSEPVEVRVAEVRRVRSRDAESGPINGHIILEEVAGDRTLTIWVGEAEANAAALRLEGIDFPRPMTYQLTQSLLTAAGARVLGATVERLTDDVFYASVQVEGSAGPRTVDARPSDAINLALLAGAPIRVAVAVFTAANAAEARPPAEIVERGPEIAARVVESWTKQPGSRLSYQSA